ncbi:MAG: condensation domain-containing protein, partial [Terriglobia bacterium]
MTRNSHSSFTLNAKGRALFDAMLARKGIAPTRHEIPRRLHSDSTPCSFAQQRLWFLDRLTPGKSFYNIPAALRLKGCLDPAVLEQS